MGIMSVLKWLRKEGNSDRQRWSMSPELSRLNNEASRIKAIRAFMDRRKSENESHCLLISNPDKEIHFNTFVKKINQGNKGKETNSVIPGVPHIKFSELFEIGWVPGTEDHYLEHIYAEWDNTKVALKKHTNSECENAIKADLEVLTEIRHPNIVLLIATSHIEGHGLISIFESLNCTLYNYIHEKRERISIQEMSRCIRKLTEALGFVHMRGFIHSSISSHCVFLASGVIKLGGWELATRKNEIKEEREFEKCLKAEIFRWQAPEIFSGCSPTEATDIYGLSLLIWEMTTMHLPWNGLSKAEINKQYLYWKQGVLLEPYNFPPLLNKLLEVGLEIDVAKRSLSMNRMSRTLQRLELQYESEAPIYADLMSNNNNIPNIKSFNSPVYTTPTKKYSTSLLDSNNVNLTPKTVVTPKKEICHNVGKSNSKKDPTDTEPLRTEETDNEELIPDIKKCTNSFLEIERLYNNIEKDFWSSFNYDGEQDHSPIQTTIQTLIQTIADSEIETSIQTIADSEIESPIQTIADSEIESPIQTIADSEIESSIQTIADSEIETSVQTNANEESNYSSEERISSIPYDSTSSQTLDFFEEKDFNKTLNDIKKLRESLANERKRFFYGDSLQNFSNTSTEDKSTALDVVRSKDYQSYKPASHKTSFEPKVHKTLPYETLNIKPIKQNKQANIPDSTFEDLYIDDEFGESLNVNMVLLDNKDPLDEDILPDLLELSHNSLFNR